MRAPLTKREIEEHLHRFTRKSTVGSFENRGKEIKIYENPAVSRKSVGAILIEIYYDVNPANCTNEVKPLTSWLMIRKDTHSTCHGLALCVHCNK